MANVQLYALIPDKYSFDGFYYEVDLTFASGSRAQFVEDAAAGGDGDQVIIEGKNLAYNGTTLIGGVVTKVTFENADGDLYAVVDHLHTKASKLPTDQDGHLDARSMDYILLAGDDIIHGSPGKDFPNGRTGDDQIFGTGGNDVFWGEYGDDTLTGGAGRDKFYVGPHPGPSYGHDVITDFQVSGPQRDRLMAETTECTITKSGKHDTLITFDDETSTLLLNVDRHDISRHDILLVI